MGGVKWQLKNKSKCSKASATKSPQKIKTNLALSVRNYGYNPVMRALLVYCDAIKYQKAGRSGRKKENGYERGEGGGRHERGIREGRAGETKKVHILGVGPAFIQRSSSGNRPEHLLQNVHLCIQPTDHLLML